MAARGQGLVMGDVKDEQTLPPADGTDGLGGRGTIRRVRHLRLPHPVVPPHARIRASQQPPKLRRHREDARDTGGPARKRGRDAEKAVGGAP